MKSSASTQIRAQENFLQFYYPTTGISILPHIQEHSRQPPRHIAKHGDLLRAAVANTNIGTIA